MDDYPINTYEDLQALIKYKAQENLHLDFKASAALGKADKQKNEISKDVTSFANSDGGTIIYGIVEVDHKADRVDEGTDVIDKEWLENVITSTVSPRIENIRIIPIEISSGFYTYIVHIPRSNRAPHQASDKRFYKRYNFKNVPMEQYEVMDVMNRKASPQLSLSFELQRYIGELPLSLSLTQAKINNPFSINIQVVNHTETPAEYFVVRVFIDSAINVYPIQIIGLKQEQRSFNFNRDELKVSVLSFMWSPQDNGLVWKGENGDLIGKVKGKLILDITQPETGASYLLGYEITAPHMNKVIAYRAIHVGPSSFRISEKEFYRKHDIAFELGL